MTTLTITLDHGKPAVDSFALADTLGIEHKHLIRTIKKHKSRIEEFGKVSFQNAPFQSGQRQIHTLLNESQAIFVLTLSRNTDQVLTAKAALTSAFDRLRKQAEQRAVLGWQQARLTGKVIRRTETDAIKRFELYAYRQGSKNADKYYMAFTKAVNRIMGVPTAGRDGLSVLELADLGIAERVISVALDQAMAQGLAYKDCFQYAKRQLEAMQSAYLPKGTALLEAAHQ